MKDGRLIPSAGHFRVVRYRMNDINIFVPAKIDWAMENRPVPKVVFGRGRAPAGSSPTQDLIWKNRAMKTLKNTVRHAHKLAIRKEVQQREDREGEQPPTQAQREVIPSVTTRDELARHVGEFVAQIYFLGPTNSMGQIEPPRAAWGKARHNKDVRGRSEVQEFLRV